MVVYFMDGCWDKGELNIVIFRIFVGIHLINFTIVDKNRLIGFQVTGVKYNCFHQLSEFSYTIEIPCKAALALAPTLLHQPK